MADESFLSLWNDPTVRTVAGGTAMLGAVAGLAGSFAVVRRQSLQGDVVSHAALPGIAVAILLGGLSPWWMLLGGAIAGWLALIIVDWLVQNTKTTADSALAIVLATFFGFGLVFKSFAQRMAGSSEQIGLDQYLFGQAATMRDSDLWAIAIVGFAISFTLLICWHRLKLVSFDPAYSQTLGIHDTLWTGLLTTIVVAAVVIGLQAVGVVLMSALIVAPAIAARFLTNRLFPLVIMASLMGALAGFTGTIMTLGKAKVPTGPVIVLTATGFVIVGIVLTSVRRFWTVSLRR